SSPTLLCHSTASSLERSATPALVIFFFLTDTAPPLVSTLSLHDALPICRHPRGDGPRRDPHTRHGGRLRPDPGRLRPRDPPAFPDRKSTRLNSSHRTISYAVFCLKKKTHSGDRQLPQQLLARHAALMLFS